MSFGGFGLSPGDFVLLIQLARRTFRNCQQAGHEYAEIASEVRCLHSVLRTVRKLAERPDSRILRQDSTTTAQLISCADGCKHVLDDLDHMLVKYETLNGEGQPSVSKKLWQRLRFGSRSEELGIVRGKLITYTSTMSVLIDTIQTQAIGRVETKIDVGFGEVKGEFERMRKEIYSMAAQARAEERNGSSLSLLSLSTYAGDEKEVWRAFRRELIMKGFRTQSLDKYRDVLQAYMLKLDRSGLLETPHNYRSSKGDRSWWSNRMFMETFGSLPDLPLRENPENRSDIDENGPPPGVTFAPYPYYWYPAPGVEGYTSPTEEFSPKIQGTSAYLTHGSAPRKVVFVANSRSHRELRNRTKATHSLKSILREPTPTFPEDPYFIREGISLRTDTWGGQVPKDARITILDKSLFDIKSLLWVAPRCEDGGDYIVVFKILNKTEIRISKKLTAFYREYPGLEIPFFFNFLKEAVQSYKANFILHGLYNEYYPHQSPLPGQNSSYRFFEMSHPKAQMIEAWLRMDEWIDECIDEFMDKNRNIFEKLCNSLQCFPAEECRMLDERLDSFRADLVLLASNVLRQSNDPSILSELEKAPYSPSRIFQDLHVMLNPDAYRDYESGLESD